MEDNIIMDNLTIRCRGYVRNVAYTDLIVQYFGLMTIVLLSMISIVITIIDPIQLNLLFRIPNEQVEALLPALVWVFWVITAVYAIETACMIWADFKLLSASESGNEPHEALQNAQKWWNVTTTLLLFSILRAIGSLGSPIAPQAWFAFVPTLIMVIWRMAILSLVYKFMEELEKVAAIDTVPQVITPQPIESNKREEKEVKV